MAEHQGPDDSQYRRRTASEIADSLRERAARGERGYWPERPRLRLREDVPSVEVSGSTRAQEVLDLLAREGRTVALGSRDTGVTAVVVPIEQYVELAGAAINGDDRLEMIEGRSVPSPTALADAGIEQIDPSVEWQVGARRY